MTAQSRTQGADDGEAVVPRHSLSATAEHPHLPPFIGSSGGGETMTVLADVFMWCWCWLAYRIVLAMPTCRAGSALDRVWFWLLPFAGYYGYHDPDFTTWRWSRRAR